MATQKRGGGRKSIYPTKIEPYLDKIEKWIKNGATEKQICDALGISVSAFNAHKDKEELCNALKLGKTNLILDLRGELARIALPHNQTTQKNWIKKEEDGKETTYTEITTKELDGDVAAIHLLLKNLDRDEWADNWKTIEFKQQELKIKQQMAENSMWK